MSAETGCDLLQLFVCFEMIAYLKPAESGLKVEGVWML
jgi:hypothetical protein